MSKPASPPLSRRQVFAGAGTAAGLAAAAAVLPLAHQAAATKEKSAAPDADGRYQVTQHVLRYYQTTKV